MNSKAIKTAAFYSPPLTKRKVNALNGLIDDHLSLVNFFVERGLEANISSRIRLHELFYEESKKIIPSDKIHSKYRYTALEVASAILKNHAKRGGKRPEIKRKFIKLYHENYNEKSSVFRIAKKDDKYFLVVKVRKRKEIVIPLTVSDYQRQFIEAYFNGRLKIGEAVLKLDGGIAIVYIPFVREVGEKNTENIMAIDVNERNVTLSVFSPDGKLLFSKYIDISRLVAIDSTYVNAARKLTSRLYRGINPRYLPRWVREKVKKRLKRWKKRKEDIVHKLSKYIVDIALSYNAEIVMEDLKRIKERILSKNNKSGLNRRFSLANFRKIQNFIEYKAKWHGIRVSYVNPAHTSSICPFCGSKLSSPDDGENKDPMGRRALYCPSCGKYYHRDFIATLNLFRKYKEKKREMCGVRVPHEGPMKVIRTGAVLPDGVWHRGNLAVTMSPGYG